MKVQIWKSIYARLAETSSFSEDPPSPPNLYTDISVVQNSSSNVNISEGLNEDDSEVLKFLNEFLNTSNEALVSPNKRKMLQPQIIGCLDIFALKPFLTEVTGC